MKDTQDRIIEIALESGFESQEAFSRAFKKYFGKNPREFRVSRPNIDLRGLSRMGENFINNLTSGVFTMEPKFEAKRGFYAIGMGGEFQHGKTEGIGELWDRFLERMGEIENKKGEEKGKYPAYGICEEIWINGENQDHFRYYAAVEVAPGSKTPEGMKSIKIESQKYAVFTTKNGLAGIGPLTEYIWGNWLAQSGREVKPASDIEYYSADFDPESKSTQVEIWVPVE